MSTPTAARNRRRMDHALRDLVERVPRETADAFMLAVEGRADSLDKRESDGPDPDLWGPEPLDADDNQHTLNSLRRSFQARQELQARSLMVDQVANLLELSVQAIRAALGNRQLVGLKVGRGWRLPAWQFSPDTEKGYLPALDKLQATFPGGAVSLSRWATRPSIDLADNAGEPVTPVQALIAGRVKEVVAVAHALHAAAW